MTRVPDSVVEERAADFIGKLNDPRQMCIRSSVPQWIDARNQIAQWVADFSLFTHNYYHLYPGWDQHNFAHYDSLLPTAQEVEKQHEDVFCKNCSSRCNDISPKVLGEAAERRGFRIAMEHLRHLIPLNEKMAGAVMSLEREGELLFGVDWNKE